MPIIYLTKGQISEIDEIDSDLTQYKWHTCGPNDDCYAVRRVGSASNRKIIRLHRIIMERTLGRSLTKGEFVDHIDGDRLNNRRDNLRLSTISQNNQNRRKSVGLSSKYKGTSRARRNEWQSQATMNNKKFHLGHFKTEEEAHAVYCETVKHYHKEFGRYN